MGDVASSAGRRAAAVRPDRSPAAPVPSLDFTARVWAMVRLVPRGRVVSYGGVAALLGQPRAARGVGGALAALRDDSDVPWWRVVNRNGEVSIKGPMHGAAIQRMLLEKEGVRFGATGRVDWTIFGWTPEPEEIPAELVVDGYAQPGSPVKPVKRSVSFAIFRPDRPGEVLVVRRPPDDEDLPDLWGLPAGSLRPGEDWADAVRRAGCDKLGVALDVGAELNRGQLERAGYTLEMRLLEARVLSGEPEVPQPVEGVTQYTSWQWATADVLGPAAVRGSLCSRLFLER